MSKKTLYPHQSKLMDELKRAVVAGKRKILVQAPTAFGKSVFFSKIIEGAAAKDNSSLLMVHLRGLILQASGHMDNEDIFHGIIMAGKIPNLYEKTQLASIQTLRSRCLDSDKVPLPLADVVIIDEAHNSASKTYDRILENYPDALIIGVTATPVRKTGKGLGDFYEELIIGPTVRELMDGGYLAEASYMVPNIPDLGNVKSLGGDYVETQLDTIMNDAALIGDIVDHWKKYASDRKTICFSVNVAHSRAIVDNFNAAGIPAAHIDGKTKQEERDKIIQDYSDGKYKVLSNCYVFVEGFDLPAVDAVILARPTKSLKVYIQMGGRGLRPKENGGDCLILDHSGSVLRHGPLDMAHDWSLDTKNTIEQRDQAKKEKPKEAKEYVCDGCGNVFSRQSVCPKCGTPLGKTSKDVDTQRGELVEFKPMKKEKPQFSKQEFYSMALTHATEKKYNPYWANHLYKQKFGVWPRGLNQGLLTRTPEFLKYIQYTNIRRSKSGTA